MKFINIIRIVFVFTLFILINNNEVEPAIPKTTPKTEDVQVDPEYQKILDSIIKLAQGKLKTNDINAKKKEVGSIPETNSEQATKKSQIIRSDKKQWMPLLSYPTELYKMCLYPIAKVNYHKWCKSAFFASKNKGDSCLHNFCEVCCDNLPFIYQNAATSNLIGELLKLSEAEGKKLILATVDKSNVMNCKAQCSKLYPVKMPEPLVKPPRDPDLGTEKKPAKSCSDIMKWGAEKTGSKIYWLELEGKGKVKAFCDMETDNGGWTLFLNYKHQPGQELFLNENSIPSDLKTNSHMYLKTAGFKEKDVKELRFFCTEIANGVKRYWHFKTKNPEIVSVAMTGDQSSLKLNSLSSSYIDLKPISAMQGKYAQSVSQKQIAAFKIFGNNPKGGFTSQSFGSSEYNAFWTIKGDSTKQDVYECGSSHKSTGDKTSDKTADMIFTHHSIWFRGAPASTAEASERLLKSVNKKIK